MYEDLRQRGRGVIYRSEKARSVLVNDDATSSPSPEPVMRRTSLQSTNKWLSETYGCFQRAVLVIFMCYSCRFSLS